MSLLWRLSGAAAARRRLVSSASVMTFGEDWTEHGKRCWVRTVSGLSDDDDRSRRRGCRWVMVLMTSHVWRGHGCYIPHGNMHSSMLFLLFSYDFLMIFLWSSWFPFWFSYGFLNFLIISLWFSYDFIFSPMIFLWFSEFSYDFLMIFLSIVYTLPHRNPLGALCAVAYAQAHARVS